MSGQAKKMLGILGGMGPLSSAEFLKTIYEYSPLAHSREQEAPAALVYSDPSFPDRTEFFLEGKEQEILDRLIEALQAMLLNKVSKIVICCVTMHYLLPRLPTEIRSRIISMIDVAFDALQKSRSKSLLLCSTGTRKLRLFEDHPGRREVDDRLLFLNDSDQRQLFQLIHKLKNNTGFDEIMALLDSLPPAYGADTFVVGCSEIHMVAKYSRRLPIPLAESRWIDPFDIVARKLTEERL